MSYENEKEVKQSNASKIVIIILSAVLGTILLVGTVVYTSIAISSKRSSASDTAPMITVSPYNSVVSSENPVFTLSGTIFDGKKTASLYINEELICTYTKEDIGKPKEWSAMYTLSPDSNYTYEIVLENSRGDIDTETCNVTCKSVSKQTTTTVPNKSIHNGVGFTKSRPGGLNVRRYAGTDYDVIYFINRNDYTTELTYLGSYDYDYEGYIWYHVLCPNGMSGYVRSDLVEISN